MNCGSTTKEFFAMPLSVYVLLSFAVSGYVAYSASADLQKPAGCVSYFLYLLMGFAVLSSVFAIYVQCRVWKEIVSDVPDENGQSNKDRIREFTEAQNQEPQKESMLAKAKKGGGGLVGQAMAAANQARGAPVPAQNNAAQEPDPEVPSQPGKRIVPAEVVQASFRKVFMEDLGVLLMFFLMIGMCVVTAKPELIEPKGTANDPVELCEYEDARSTGYLFFILAFLFSFTYLCCKCCSNKVAIPEEDPADESGAE